MPYPKAEGIKLMHPGKLSRSEQSRVNGAKSQGPVTGEGKARSAANAIKHGMYSSRVCLENEDPALYALLMRLYMDLLQPEDIIETDLVENMVNARWRIRRLESSQTADMNLALAENRTEFTNKWGPGALDPAMEQALTFRALTAQAKAFDALIRFEERLHRIYERSYRLLLKHRKKSGKPLPGAPDLRDLEAGLPANDATTTQNERNEPETPPAQPAQSVPSGILHKVAIIAILLLMLAAANIRPLFAQFSTPPPMERVLQPHRHNGS